MNIYPQQLQCILHYIEALNAADAKIIALGLDEYMSASIKRVEIWDEDHSTLLGHLVDEIGGAWSFEAVSG